MNPRSSVIPHLTCIIRARSVASTPRHLSKQPPRVKHVRDGPGLLRSKVTGRRYYASANGSSRWLEARLHKPSRSSSPRMPRYEERNRSIPSKRNPVPMVFASCLFGVALGIWLTFVYVSFRKAAEKAEQMELVQNSDVSDRWKDRTRDFDKEVDTSETFMLLRAKRKRLISQAGGSVLEVSCGTGRNMDLYDLRPYDPKEDEKYGRNTRYAIRNLTFNDQSEVMIEQAIQKLDRLNESYKRRGKFEGTINFVVGDAGMDGVITRPTGGYDTIIQTMGVCSMADASRFLRKLGELCRQPGERTDTPLPSDDDGRGGKILLLEHGRGHYDWINDKILDKIAKTHADKYGCWWNKDIGRVVEQSGLIVEKIRRYNFGTTWEIVLRPNPLHSQQQEVMSTSQN